MTAKIDKKNLEICQVFCLKRKSQWIEINVHDNPPAIYPVTRLAAVTCRLNF